MLFHLEVVRGPNSHIGGLTGVAFVDGSHASFVAVVPDTVDEAKLSLKHLSHLLEVEGTGAIHYFHGLSAYFDGVYVRTRTLTPSEQLGLLRMIGRAD